jgi:hypothetical protein
MLCHSLKQRGQRGSQLVEALSIGIFILMITLALIDLLVIVMANSTNDAAAKNAARAAANQPDHARAVQAAENAVNSRQRKTGFISALILQAVDYEDHKIVSCTTKMELKLPIPIPGIGGNMIFMAQATEPIVAH